VGNWLFWNAYKNAGYATLFANNICQDYTRTFFEVNQTNTDYDFVVPFCHPDYTSLVDTYSNFHGPYSFSKRCIAGKHVHSYLFDYISDFFDNYSNVSKLAVASVLEGHEGSGSVITASDEDLVQFLETLLAKHSNTVVVLVSDHGLHMGLYWMMTEAGGKYEWKLPALYTVFPTEFLSLLKMKGGDTTNANNKNDDDTNKNKNNVESNLKNNQQQLLTHYDLYKTLLQLPTYPEVSSIYSNHPQRWLLDSRAISLFDEVPTSRTCKLAGVQTKFCVCDDITKPEQTL